MKGVCRYTVLALKTITITSTANFEMYIQFVKKDNNNNKAHCNLFFLKIALKQSIRLCICRPSVCACVHVCTCVGEVRKFIRNATK